MAEQNTDTILKPAFSKSGYLLEEFRIFHNADTNRRVIPSHYHDFHKLILFISGNVSYILEGRQFDLKPWDIVLVPAGLIHRPVIHDNSLYERIITYISPDFFEAFSKEDGDLSACFSQCEKTHEGLIRPDASMYRRISGLASNIREAVKDNGFGAGVLRRIRLTEFLLLVNRLTDREDYIPAVAAASNPIILKAMDFINANLSNEDLSVDMIAKETALNRSYLMHLFKAQTGYTIGGYIREKRLFQACTLLKNGSTVTQACYRSGFSNYAAFYYAYRKKYASPPAQGRNAEKQFEGE